MADVELIRDLATGLINALAKTSSPNDIVEGFDEALEAYEELINSAYKK